MPGVQIPSLTPYVTPTRTGALLSHNSCVELEFSGGETIEFSSSEMLEYIRYIQRYATIPTRTYWCEFPFYTVINNFKQQYRLGYRPEDLFHIETIEQKVWEKHLVHLNRLEKFPLNKAEYYLRLKESHGVNSVRGLSKITGEDWSYIARILRTLDLPEAIKGFLKSNKDNSSIIQFFHLRRLLDIVRQREERLQIARFRELMEECEERKIINT